MAYKKTHNRWKAFGAILLALVLFAGGCTLGWFAKQNKWFEKDPSPAEDQDGKNEKSQTLRFEAEDGELSGGCRAVDDSQNEDGRTYVGDFTNSATVTFELDASAETPVTMLVRITSPREDTPLKELMTINVNGEPFESDVTAKGAGEAKWTTWQTLLAGRIVLKEGANAIVFGGAFDGVNFDFFKILFPASVTVTVHQEVGGLAVDKSAQGSGISLVSTHIPVALYEEYGISPAAENAQTITATVSPDNDATNSGVTWSAAWENPASEWATGKEVQNYLTLTPAGKEYRQSKTVTVQCLKAFGEKIIITCKSVDNPAIQATVNVHYIERVIEDSLTLKFGDDITCNFDDGITTVPFECGAGSTGKGGKFSIEYETSDHTLASERSVALEWDNSRSEYALLHIDEDTSKFSPSGEMVFATKTEESTMYGNLEAYFDFSTYDVEQNGIEFSYDFFTKNFHLCHMTHPILSANMRGNVIEDMSGTAFFNRLGVTPFINYPRDPMYYGLFKLKIQFDCEEAEKTVFQKETIFVIDVDQAVNTSTISSISPNEENLYF